ncbi:MAG: addiction module protein [bacterium]|nr:addiction module protein [bacterium]
MMITAEKIRSEAMSLPVSERASLAHDLILSLDSPSDFDLGQEREIEIRRRVQMVKEGRASGRPADEVFSDIEAKFK